MALFTFSEPFQTAVVHFCWVFFLFVFCGDVQNMSSEVPPNSTALWRLTKFLFFWLIKTLSTHAVCSLSTAGRTGVV